MASNGILGPMSSPDGIMDCWVSAAKRLQADETLLNPTVASASVNVVPSGVVVNPTEFVDSQGKTVPAGQAILFRLTTDAALAEDVNLTITWDTSSGEHDSAVVAVRIVNDLTEFT